MTGRNTVFIERAQIITVVDPREKQQVIEMIVYEISIRSAEKRDRTFFIFFLVTTRWVKDAPRGTTHAI